MMSEDNLDEFDVLYKELRTAYATKLPSKFKALEDAIVQARSAPSNGTLSKNAANEAHKIKGTAGSHGFTEISLLAEIIEELLESLVPDDATKQATTWPKVDEALAKGKRLAEEVACLYKPTQESP